MDVLSLVKIIIRRWVVVLPIVLLTVLVAWQVAKGVEPTYEAQASVLLTGMLTPETPIETDAGSSGVVSAPIMAEILKSGEADNLLRDAGATAEFDVRADAEGGIINVQASHPTDGAAAVRTAVAVIEFIQGDVERRQEEAGVPEQQKTTAQILAAPTQATPARVVDPGTGEAQYQQVVEGAIALIQPAPVVNPYAATPYTARVLQELTSAETIQQEVLDQGATSTYEVATERRDAAPLLYLLVTGTDPDNVLHTLDALLDRMEAELAERQTAVGVPEVSQTTLDRIVVPTAATQVAGELMRPLVTIVGIGIMLALSLAVLADGVFAAGSRRRRSDSDVRPEDEWTMVDAASLQSLPTVREPVE